MRNYNVQLAANAIETNGNMKVLRAKNDIQNTCKTSRNGIENMHLARSQIFHSVVDSDWLAEVNEKRFAK